MKDLFNGYALPKTNKAEVLLTLIIQGYVSIFDFPYMSGFRTRVSNLVLNDGLFLERITLNKKNKFGNVYTYAKHILNENQKEKAIEIYNKINK